MWKPDHRGIDADVECVRTELRAQIAYGRKLAEHGEDMLRLLEILSEPAERQASRTSPDS